MGKRNARSGRRSQSNLWKATVTMVKCKKSALAASGPSPIAKRNRTKSLSPRTPSSRLKCVGDKLSPDLSPNALKRLRKRAPNAAGSFDKQKKKRVWSKLLALPPESSSRYASTAAKALVAEGVALSLVSSSPVGHRRPADIKLTANRLPLQEHIKMVEEAVRGVVIKTKGDPVLMGGVCDTLKSSKFVVGASASARSTSRRRAAQASNKKTAAATARSLKSARKQWQKNRAFVTMFAKERMSNASFEATRKALDLETVATAQRLASTRRVVPVSLRFPFLFGDAAALKLAQDNATSFLDSRNLLWRSTSEAGDLDYKDGGWTKLGFLPDGADTIFADLKISRSLCRGQILKEVLRLDPSVPISYWGENGQPKSKRTRRGLAVEGGPSITSGLYKEAKKQHAFIENHPQLSLEIEGSIVPVWGPDSKTLVPNPILEIEGNIVFPEFQVAD